MRFIMLAPSTASTATASTSTGNASCTSPRRISASSRRPPYQPLTRPSATPITPATRTAEKPTASDTRAPIGGGLENVDDQVDRDEDEREDEHPRLDHREVTRRHRLHDQPPHARPREHSLDDQRAAQHEAEREPGDGDDGQRRVTERVA